MKTFIICLLLLPVLLVRGQQPEQSGIIVYKPFEATDSLDPENIHIDKTSIKWNYTLALRGVFALSAEYMFTHKLSGEVGLGPTYRDFIFETIQDIQESDFPDISDQEVSMGYMVSGSLRFYPKEGDLEGIYISPLFRYRNYKISTSEGSTTGAIDVPIGYRIRELAFIIGYQSFALATELTYEAYVGFGMNYLQYKSRFDDGLSVSWIDKKKDSPAFLFGWTIGLPF
ncbi:MAG TPA: hypothetical protein P5531_00440 [Bacteroidales bacterium]|nr:hypothetical protein [Bacteroidales bacterium]HSA42127.1 hypothetical protein [Bacteroidales bacterium]